MPIPQRLQVLQVSNYLVEKKVNKWFLKSANLPVYETFVLSLVAFFSLFSNVIGVFLVIVWFPQQFLYFATPRFSQMLKTADAKENIDWFLQYMRSGKRIARNADFQCWICICKLPWSNFSFAVLFSFKSIDTKYFACQNFPFKFLLEIKCFKHSFQLSFEPREHLDVFLFLLIAQLCPRTAEPQKAELRHSHNLSRTF